MEIKQKYIKLFINYCFFNHIKNDKIKDLLIDNGLNNNELSDIFNCLDLYIIDDDI